MIVLPSSNHAVPLKEPMPVGEHEGQLGPNHAAAERAKGQAPDLPTAEPRRLSKTEEERRARRHGRDHDRRVGPIHCQLLGGLLPQAAFFAWAKPEQPDEKYRYGDGSHAAADYPRGYRSIKSTQPATDVRAHRITGEKAAKTRRKESDTSGNNHDHRNAQNLEKTDSRVR